MPPAVIDIRGAEDSRDVVHRAVQALVEGQLVAFPTETVYGLAASVLNEKAVQRLLKVKGRPEGHPLALAIKSAEEALDYVPDVCPLGRRLARRCWPGPLTLVLPDCHPDSLIQQLPTGVRNAIVPRDEIGLRVPAHPLIMEVLRLLTGPVALTSANRSGQPDTISASEVIDQLDDDVQLVLDDGRCQFGQPSSVVQVKDNRVRMLRRGVISESHLKRLSSHILLFVCTGNTCRSPMAEVLCRKRLAERLQCTPGDLDDLGVIVTSAGIAAMAGGVATPEAVQVMAQRKLDLSRHEAQPLSPRLVKHADLILTMTHGHRDAILGQWPEAVDRTELLSALGHDISDPVGGSIELYERCATQIDDALAGRIERWGFEHLGAGDPGGLSFASTEDSSTEDSSTEDSSTEEE